MGYYVLTNVSKGDIVKFYINIKNMPVIDLALSYTLSELTESSDNLPNKIHAFVTE